MTEHPPDRALAEASGGRRILFVSGLQLHPTVSGGTLRSLALAEALAGHGYDVLVHSLTGRKAGYLSRQPSSEQRWPGGVTEYVDRSAASMMRWLGGYVAGLPPIWLTAHLAAATRLPGELLLPSRLRHDLARCEVILADFPFLYPILSTPSARGKLRIVNNHNIEHRQLAHSERFSDRFVRAAVRAIELRAAASCDILVNCCTEDAAYFTASVPVRQSIVVPNGVDVRRFDDIKEHRSPTRRQLGLPDEAMVVLYTASKWGPNREAYDFLLEFARRHRRFLEERAIHILVVGSVTSEPLRIPGFTATGRVLQAEPYFGAADIALNPIVSGTGTNLKTCEYLAARLPILTTTFGARGFAILNGRTGFIFERDGLAAALADARRAFDAQPGHLREIAAVAFSENESVVDMRVGARGLADAIRAIPRPGQTSPSRLTTPNARS